MTRFFALVLSLLFAGVPRVEAQGVDDQYVRIFNLVQEADGLAQTKPHQALTNYIEARDSLERLQKGSPGWNPNVVQFRLDYVRGRIESLSPAAGSARTASTPQAGASGPAQAGTRQEGPAAPADWELQLRNLQGQVAHLQGEKGLLEAKLKEALAMRPAVSDPRELARAEEKIKVLQKEIELLRAEREQAKRTDPAARVAERPPQDSPAEAEAARQLNEQKTLCAQLALEKEALQNRLRNLEAASAGTMQSPTANSAAEKAAQPAKSSDPSADRRLKQLQQERNDLERRLEAANKELAARKGKAAAKRIQDLETQLAGATALLAALEAQAVAYTEEELALFKNQAPRSAAAAVEPAAPAKAKRELPPGSAPLVAEAQGHFAAREFDKAEAVYLRVLELDRNNVPALANLAAVQFEAGHLNEAEATVKKALAEAPDDAYSLYMVGLISLRQGKFDDAVSALSRCARIDPKNSEVQNYLGLALSEKGLRVPAEAALRRAVQLQPGNSNAHFNLAIVYASQQPPALELARWHYQKAVAGGHPRHAALETKFEAGH